MNWPPRPLGLGQAPACTPARFLAVGRELDVVEARIARAREVLGTLQASQANPRAVLQATERLDVLVTARIALLAEFEACARTFPVKELP